MDMSISIVVVYLRRYSWLLDEAIFILLIALQACLFYKGDASFIGFLRVVVQSGL
jgi:hypothetical protein